MSLSIIMPSYVTDLDNFRILQQCLASLKVTVLNHEEFKDTELIIVDNGSIPEASDFMKKYATTYVYKPEPIGWARCNNIGLSLSEGDYKCIINNDIGFYDGWCQSLIGALIGTEKLGIASSNDGAISIPDGTINYRHFYGSCFMMYKNTFLDIGYFDERLNYRFADQDYWCRILSLGKKIGCVGSSHIEHANGATWYKIKDYNEIAKKEGEIMQKRYGVKHVFEWIKTDEYKEILDKLIS